ncbi:YbhB/YbcL family Raf kinase inhibitor-like protein [soil metagenome]
MKKIILIASFFANITLNAQTFTLKSNELGGQASEKQVFNSFGCNGKNLSPQLFWENPPADAKSFAITIFDEDAPTGSGWWHWLIFDIPATVNELNSGAGNISLSLSPRGSIQSITDFKSQGYGGPCPPERDKSHKYIVTVYALKTEKLGLDSTANPALVGFMLGQNLVEKSSLIFYYKR